MKTFEEVHAGIDEVDRLMGELVDEITGAGTDAAITEATFKVEFAKARLRARAEAAGRRITTDEAEDIATVATENQRQGYLIAANNLQVLREVNRTLQSRMDGLRTQATSFRQAGG